jgi:hypothetical protein
MSEFSTEGQQSFPSIYQDYEQVAQFSEWPTDALIDRLAEYTEFLKSEDLMPRARQQAELITRHALFELSWRGAQELHHG